MFYIVGLGNPGKKYTKTRHNVAWLVLDRWLTQTGLPTLYESAKVAGRVTEGFIHNEEVTVLYPNTYMNKSGSAVKKLVPKAQAHQLVVVYDDIDIPLGEIKISFGKGSGGHNGVQSIITALGTNEFVRIRVGICPRSFWSKKPVRPRGDRLPSYVLGQFTRREQKELDAVSERVHAALQQIVTDGYQAAMNTCN